MRKLAIIVGLKWDRKNICQKNNLDKIHFCGRWPGC